MPRKKKHPRKMTTEEAAKHLFHPKIHKHLKKLLREQDAKKPMKKG